ncbi:MAG: transposase [Candidatus Omnitrophica bacterium]|nr:transposase [Candidatus Omnitrophota bacterium]
MPSYARTYQLKGNLLYHVINRANARCTIFHDKEDFTYFVKLLSNICNKADFKIYHWVIMSNHYHILIEIDPPERLSSIMASINRLYSIYHHKRYSSCGYLWQGRFKSQAVQKDSYLISCGRYIERNPVKAGIVRSAEDYSYSSARFYVCGKSDMVTSISPFYETLGNSPLERQNAYHDMLIDDNQDEDDYFENFEHPLGSNIFKAQLIKTNGRHIPRRKGRPKTVRLKW